MRYSNWILFICISWNFISCQSNANHKEYSKLDINIDSLKVIMQTFHGSGLILRIKEDDCYACIDYELENLNRLPTYFKNRTILLTKFKNLRALGIILTKHKSCIPVINYQSAIPINQEKIGKPYYFLIDQNYYISKLHISSLEDSISTFTYYNDIERYLIKIDSQNHVPTFLKLDKSSSNLGNIELNSTHTITFTFENISNKSVIIENVIATCGCTSVDWEKSPIGPNDKASITITFRATSQGYFFKKIIFKLSGNSDIQVLSISGFVI